MTPSELRQRLSTIVAEETGISVCWAEHEAPMSLIEIGHVESRVRQLLAEEYHKTVKRQQEMHRGVLAARA